MKIKATIYLSDHISNEKPSVVKKFYGSFEELVLTLKNLQLEYCETEKPVVTNPNKNEIIVTSDCDFFHIAFLTKES